MKNQKIILIAAAVCLACFGVVCAFLYRPMPHAAAPAPAQVVLTAPAPPLDLAPSEQKQKKAKDFTPEEKERFLATFNNRLKPALTKWLKAYGHHVPFNDVTPDNFYSRIGTSDTFSEYVFTIDGMTLTIDDKDGSSEVNYLNNPEQTKLLASLPQRAHPPTTQLPVQRQEVAAMVLADGGTQFAPDQIRMIPSGLSGSMDGGAFVHVGGNPQNAASWKFDMVFTRDGKMAYYLRGVL